MVFFQLKKHLHVCYIVLDYLFVAKEINTKKARGVGITNKGIQPLAFSYLFSTSTYGMQLILQGYQ